MQMNFHRKLPIPKEVKEEFPVSERMKQVKEQRDESIRAVFEGKSDKFILIIGPCSADSKEPVLEYISRLRRIQETVADKILIILRRNKVINFFNIVVKSCKVNLYTSGFFDNFKGIVNNR